MYWKRGSRQNGGKGSMEFKHELNFKLGSINGPTKNLESIPTAADIISER